MQVRLDFYSSAVYTLYSMKTDQRRSSDADGNVACDDVHSEARAILMAKVTLTWIMKRRTTPIVTRKELELVMR